jgi:3-oxoacyl-(acyl-carrier-protein) synthase
MRRRVKITGIGPVTPAGIGMTAFWAGIQEPISRVRLFDKLGEQYGPMVAAHLAEFEPGDYIDVTAMPKACARQTYFAAVAAQLALKDANVPAAEFGRANCAIVTGSTLMDFGGIGSTIDGVSRRGIRGAKPRTVYTTNTASIPGAINSLFGINSRTMTVQSSCCSGIDAIGYAANMVATGESDLVICGGTDAPLYRTPLVELRAAGLTPASNDQPHKLVRPFDMWRTTGVISEGACMILIEPESSPREGYAYITGYAFANDPIDQLCGGMAGAATLALADAHRRPSEVDVINAWGPGHRLIDESEAKAIGPIFGSRLRDIPAFSIKASIGSPLGAAPAIQIATSALGLKHGVIPPTVNWDFPDPACPFNLSNRVRFVEHSTTLINCHGLAGVNASMVLERC